MNLQYEPAHKCGVFGIYNYNIENDSINACIDGISKLQHRGRESAGISYFKNNKIITYKKNGNVNKVFSNYYSESQANACIGHVRYSTTEVKNIGINNLENDDTSDLLPMSAVTNIGEFSISHNGNIPNMDKWRNKYLLKTNNDTEILLRYIEENVIIYGWVKCLEKLLRDIKGVYCLLILTQDGIYFLKDSYGYHPLCVGYNYDDDLYYISSESCAFDKKYFSGEVIPGKINFIRKKKNNKLCNQLHLGSVKDTYNSTFCLFEYIYFMNNKSIGPINNLKIEEYRYNCGVLLASIEENIENIRRNDDFIVVDIPKTATSSAVGFAKKLNLKHEQLLSKIENIGRSFILPTNEERIKFIKENIYINDSSKLYNKKIFLLDDSIVRGNTMKQIIIILRECNVKEIHLRIISPPIVGNCYFGIDIPSHSELIAYNKSINDICKELNADSLKYLDLEYINNIIPSDKCCTACLGGDYNKEVLEFTW